MRTPREQKQFEKAVIGICKILQDKNVKAVKELDGYTVVSFKNGQVFRMRGEAVQAALNGKQPDKPVKNYQTPKHGEKIGRIFINKKDEQYYKRVYVLATFEKFGEKFAVRRVAGSATFEKFGEKFAVRRVAGSWYSSFHVGTGYKIESTQNNGGGNLQKCVDLTIAKLDEQGEKATKAAIKKAIKYIESLGDIETLDDLPE